MRIIVAADEKNGIGKAGKLPWSIPEDLARFKHKTLGGHVIMGHKTWLSLPSKVRPLPGRINLVLSRNPRRRAVVLDANESPRFYTSLSDVPSWILNKDSTWVIGGSEIYSHVLGSYFRGFVSEIHLTRIVGDYECDTFWPGVPDDWQLMFKQPRAAPVEPLSGLEYRFEVWCRTP
jgi:dihydrofolate reductase